MPTTYDLVSAAQALVMALEDGEGVLTEEGENLLGLYIERSEDKLGALRAVINRCDADADVLAKEVKLLTQRKRALGKAKERCRLLAFDLLCAHEKLTGETRIKTQTYSAWLASSERIDGPDDPRDWPEDFVTERTIQEVDRRAALEALKAGKTFPRLSIHKSRSARFR